MGKNIIKSDNAVSSVIGVILILGTCILSISMILVYSMPTYYAMEDMAQTQKVEQAFTVIDSRTSKAALGESPIQTTHISLMGGTIDIKGDADAYNESYVKIQIIDNNNITEEFTCPMGSIEYEYEGRTVAYEGGGVWSKYPSGASIMISPPEFHYNGQTLTLPVMKITGDSSTGGNSDVGISIISDNMPDVLYPNKKISNNRTNPLYSDNIRVYIKSDYYDAWADYANLLTYTVAQVDDANRTAVIDLKVIPPSGPTGIKSLSPSFKVGMLNQSDPAPLKGFDMLLRDSDSSGLAPFNAEITAISGDRMLKYILKNSAQKIWIEIEYHDGVYEEYWESLDGFPVNPAKYSCDIDYLNDTLMMKYDPGKLANGTNPDYSWSEYEIFQNNASFSINQTVQHYMKLITQNESVVFNIEEIQGKGKLNFGTSSLTLDYESPGDISYLHVTTNELNTVVS